MCGVRLSGGNGVSAQLALPKNELWWGVVVKLHL